MSLKVGRPSIAVSSVRGKLTVASRPGVAMRVVSSKNCRKLAGLPQLPFTTESEADLSSWQFSSSKAEVELKLSRVLPELSLYGDYQMHLASSRLSLNANMKVQVKREHIISSKQHPYYQYNTTDPFNIPIRCI